MEKEPALVIYKEQPFTVGENTYVDSVAENNNAVIFEDDCHTGYFYAVDPSRASCILDALHIYDVANVVDKDKSCNLKILWTPDESKAFLSINNYYNAVFDFDSKAGYCLHGFPAPRSLWTRVEERTLTASMLKSLGMAP